jgi:hypothetical protein
MVDLVFAAEGAEVDRYAAAPMLIFKVRVGNATPAFEVQNVQLQCQVRIEATRRHYSPAERERLVELFGEMHRWKETLRSMLWVHANVQVPAFDDERIVELPVACSFDFNIAATKYFYGLEDGEVPLAFLFSGTVFYRDADDFLQMEQISWSKEASYRLPVRIWQELMDCYYPNSAWLRVDRKVFDDIYRYKRHKGFTSWDETLRALVAHPREESIS